jgi:hypothetical protein
MFCERLEDLDNVLKVLTIQAKSLLLNSKYGIEIDVKERKIKRTTAQNSYYWLLNGWVSDCLNGAGCTYGEFKIPYNGDLIHDINKKVFGKETTTKMNIGEFCDYMTQVICFWIEKTKGTLEIPELPDRYLERRGFTKEYMRQ